MLAGKLGVDRDRLRGAASTLDCAELLAISLFAQSLAGQLVVLTGGHANVATSARRN